MDWATAPPPGCLLKFRFTVCKESSSTRMQHKVLSKFSGDLLSPEGLKRGGETRFGHQAPGKEGSVQNQLLCPPTEGKAKPLF